MSLAETLRNHKGNEAWFCLSRFRAGPVTNRTTGEIIGTTGGYRSTDVWDYAIGAAVDLDTDNHRDMTATERAALIALARDGTLPGDLFYDSPAGGRVVRLFDAPVFDPAEYQKAAQDLLDETSNALNGVEALAALKLDSKCTHNRACLFFTPNSKAKGKQRKADVIRMDRRAPVGSGTQSLLGAGTQSSPVTTGTQSLKSTGTHQHINTSTHQYVGLRSIFKLADLSPDERAEVETAISKTLPEVEGQRHNRVFRLACRLKAVGVLADLPATVLIETVREWHKRALPVVGTQDFETTWMDFLAAWPRAEPHGAKFQQIAQAAREAPDPLAGQIAAGLGVANPKFIELLSLCCSLDTHHNGDAWPLACRLAGDTVDVNFKTAAHWLRLLERNGIIQLVKPASVASRRAAEYQLNRYWGMEP